MDEAGATARAAIGQALRRAPIPQCRPGTVTGAHRTSYVVYVQMDGDDANTVTSAQGLDYLPEIGSRVRVLFFPPSDAVVLGTMGDAVPGVY